MKSMRSRLSVAVLCAAAVAAGYLGGRPLLQQVEFARASADVQATRQQLSTVEDLSTVFRHVGKVVEPSVVQIEVTKLVPQSALEQRMRRFRLPGFGDIPLPNQAPENGDGSNDQQPNEQMGTGSGVIMEASGGVGYVLTNNHVAGGATELLVTLSDGRKIHNCKVLGTDPKSDLAVVQIKADRLIPATWGNSDELEKGDWVMAFGSPFGYIGSMTHGIVSALNRNGILHQGNDYENFIQVDAPINPGNSGGALVNIRGEVVGINVAIATVDGGFQGIGFAIPSNQAKPVYTALKDKGKVVRGWLGVSIGNVADNPMLAKTFNYSGSTGVLVQDIAPSSPAKGKLQDGDIIVKYNDAPVDNSDQLRNLVAATSPGTSAALDVFRAGKEQSIDLTVGDQPQDIEAAMGRAHGDDDGAATADAQSSSIDGMDLQTLDADAAAKLNITSAKSGAVVIHIARNSVAAKGGLVVGEVITRVGNTHVHSAQEAVDAIKKGDLSQGVRLYVAGEQGSHYALLQSDEDTAAK
ncbi:MAG: trypsin-like peptidase domain-containing protein [Planctomycetota bacterium]|nr:trypsin-like peptidase domain-containing protein [Planctomycetota bacterium]